jgi:lysozyme
VVISNKKNPAGKKKTPVKRKPAGQISLTWKIAIAAFLFLLFSPFYYGYLLKGLTSTWRWVRDIGHDPNYRLYKSFNIRMPEKYKVCGIDVSYYQGNINWRLVKHMHEDSIHISFAFIKATEGLLLVDPYFQHNWREAAKAGITRGAYHYFRPRLNGKWQARFFLQTAKTQKGDLPMVVDVEQLDGVSPDKMRLELSAYLKYIQEQTGIKPIIYSGIKFYSNNLAGYFSGYPLWIAHYYEPDLKLDDASKWKFWQHSDKAQVNGINHVVDFDVFNGDSLSFRKWLVAGH